MRPMYGFFHLLYSQRMESTKEDGQRGEKDQFSTEKNGSKTCKAEVVHASIVQIVSLLS